MPFTREFFYHKCTIADNSDSYLPPLSPNSPFYKKCLRSFRKFFLIDETNGRCEEFFRSRNSIFREKKRQVGNKKFKYMIHPFSRFCKIREVVLCFVWIIAFILEPFITSFNLRNMRHIPWTFWEFVVGYIQIVLNFVMLSDIIVNFYMGYVVKKTGHVVLEQMSIAKRYVKTFFVFDVLACFPTIFFILVNRKNFLTADLVAQMLYFRLARTFSLIEYLTAILTLYFKESSTICILFTLITFLLLHWFTCLVRMVPSILLHRDFLTESDQKSILTKNSAASKELQYLETLRATTCHFLAAGTGYGSIQDYQTIETIMLSLVTVAGLYYFLYMISRVIQLFGVVNIDESKYEEIMNQLNQYIIVKKIPKELAKRIKLYHNYKFQGKFYHETRILSTLSIPLRCEVTFYCCRGLIQRVPLFENLPKAVVGGILGLVQCDVYLPNDKIYDLEEDGKYVCFIVSGTLAVLLDDGRELVHLEDGQEFGEVCSVLSKIGQRKFFYYCAIEITEVYSISRSDMQFCLRFHPEVGELLEELGEKRLEAYRKIRDNLGHVDEPSSIVEELRMKRILEERRKRISK